MYSDEDLESAAKAGIFTDDSISKFRTFFSNAKETVSVDEEHFR